jgi:Uma2 family endonuclease
MATALKRRLLGPADHGRPFADEDFPTCRFVSGYKYELIDGKLAVTYEPDLPENRIEEWVNFEVKLYARRHPKVINYVTHKARVFVPGRPEETVPEPDLAAYRDFPLRLPFEDLNWRDVSPVLVGEVLSRNDPAKDLVRNVALYLQVPSVREYWVFDARVDAERPTLLVHRRRSRRWQPVIEVGFGETYTTRLLPGFELVVDPRR